MRHICGYPRRAEPFKECFVKEFVMGIALGMAGGALVVANSCKIRKMIKKNQDEIMQKAESYIDEQLSKQSCNRSEDMPAQ